MLQPFKLLHSVRRSIALVLSSSFFAVRRGKAFVLSSSLFAVRRGVTFSHNVFALLLLQPFKLLHAVRLCEAGLVSRAQDYCREIAAHVTRPGARIEPDFLPDLLTQLLHLSERLKYQVTTIIYTQPTHSMVLYFLVWSHNRVEIPC